MTAGEWWNYTFDLPYACRITPTLMMASDNANSQVYCLWDGVRINAANIIFRSPLPTPWENYIPISPGSVTAPAGRHTLRVACEADGWNIARIAARADQIAGQVVEGDTIELYFSDTLPIGHIVVTLGGGIKAMTTGAALNSGAGQSFAFDVVTEFPSVTPEIYSSLPVDYAMVTTPLRQMVITFSEEMKKIATADVKLYGSGGQVDRSTLIQSMTQVVQRIAGQPDRTVLTLNFGQPLTADYYVLMFSRDEGTTVTDYSGNVISDVAYTVQFTVAAQVWLGLARSTGAPLDSVGSGRVDLATRDFRVTAHMSLAFSEPLTLNIVRDPSSDAEFTVEPIIIPAGQLSGWSSGSATVAGSMAIVAVESTVPPRGPDDPLIDVLVFNVLDAPPLRTSSMLGSVNLTRGLTVDSGNPLNNFGDLSAAPDVTSTPGTLAAGGLTGTAAWFGDGVPMLWTGERDYWDMARFPPNSNLGVGNWDYCIAYVAVYVISPDPRAATLAVDTDDGERSYVNGVMVGNAPVPRGIGWIPEQDRWPITLKQGSNLIMVKVSEGVGGYGVRFRIGVPMANYYDANELVVPMSDLRYALDPNDAVGKPVMMDPNPNQQWVRDALLFGPFPSGSGGDAASEAARLADDQPVVGEATMLPTDGMWYELRNRTVARWYRWNEGQLNASERTPAALARLIDGEVPNQNAPVFNHASDLVWIGDGGMGAYPPATSDIKGVIVAHLNNTSRVDKINLICGPQWQVLANPLAAEPDPPGTPDYTGPLGAASSFFPFAPTMQDAIAYGVVYIISPDARSGVELQVVSDDAERTWVNSVQVGQAGQAGRGVTWAAPDVFAIDLLPGRNTILIKVENGTDGYAMGARLTTNSAGLNYALDPNDAVGQPLPTGTNNWLPQMLILGPILPMGISPFEPNHYLRLNLNPFANTGPEPDVLLATAPAAGGQLTGDNGNPYAWAATNASWAGQFLNLRIWADPDAVTNGNEVLIASEGPDRDGVPDTRTGTRRNTGLNAAGMFDIHNDDFGGLILTYDLATNGYLGGMVNAERIIIQYSGDIHPNVQDRGVPITEIEIFGPTLPAISLDPRSGSILVGETLPVTVSIPDFLPDDLVITLTFDPNISVDVNPVTIPAWSSSADIIVTGLTPGAANLTASAAGHADGIGRYQVTLPSITLSPNTDTILEGDSLWVDVDLSRSSPTDLVVRFTYDNQLIRVSPDPVTIPAGWSYGSITVTGVALSPATAALTASAAGYSDGQGDYTIQPRLSVEPASGAIGLGEAIIVTISIPEAQATDMAVSLAFDPSVISAPYSATILADQMSVDITVAGQSIGGSDLVASATGYVSATAHYTVRQTRSISLVPGTGSVDPGGNVAKPPAGTTMPVQVVLSEAAPAGGLIVSFTYDATRIRITPSPLTIVQGQTSAQVILAGICPGVVPVTASGANYTDGTGSYTVTAPAVTGDIVGDDHCVNVSDLLSVRNVLGKSHSQAPLQDLVGDEDGVNVADLLFVRNMMGKGWGCTCH